MDTQETLFAQRSITGDEEAGSSEETASNDHRRNDGRRVSTAALLFVLAVASGAVAFYIFPKSSPVATTGTISAVDFDSEYTPSNIGVRITPDPSVHGVYLYASLTDFSPHSTPVIVRITVPLQSFGGPDKCFRPAHCSVSGTQKQAMLWMRVQGSYLSGGARWHETHGGIAIPDMSYNLVANDEFAAVDLPDISLYVGNIHTYVDNAVTVPTLITMTVPRASRFTWNTGLVPDANNSLLVWHENSSTEFGATSENGVDLSLQDRNSKLIFVSGALLGIAGGALVGSLQEHRKRRPSSK